MDTFNKAGIARTAFLKNRNNEAIDLYSISNNNGMELYATNFGLRVVALTAPDRDNTFDNVVLGFDSIEAYLNDRGNYFGAIVGQYANRIAGGNISIEGQPYSLSINNGQNHLHGGTEGYAGVVWNLLKRKQNKLVFHKVFEDGQNGFPGNTAVTVSYELTDRNEFKISHEATTDRTTVINLSHHSFFNLQGEGSGTIKDHRIVINADHYTPVNIHMIPTGEIRPVQETVLDFSTAKNLSESLFPSLHPQLQPTKGFDHNYVLNSSPLNSEGLVFAARVEEPVRGRVMEVFTSEPGIQFYSGNFLDGTLMGMSGKTYPPHGGLCLETQHFPNSPNEPGFPNTLLKPNEIYRSKTVYKFSNQN